jgi:hypothetical protein
MGMGVAFVKVAAPAPGAQTAITPSAAPAVIRNLLDLRMSPPLGPRYGVNPP